ncbi:MAG: TAXI family TRAP transporter solute-binding subunit [candidate division NC10 bacterium]|nr:TAXI family TRAP transporter solute-binding subunit [candidate division NC10 bacterium]
MSTITRRQALRLFGIGGGAWLGGGAAARRAWAQTKTRLSIATGGTGGVYYPLGGGMAALISKSLPGVEATAEVTTASVDNMKLLHAGKIGLALTLPDTALDAHEGKLKGLAEKVGVRALMALYSNYMHIVALEGSGIKTVAALKGKRVSTGAPGSGTEVKGLRALEAYGITPKDLKSQDRLGVTESAGALKDRKIDAFIWDGGLPTAAVLDIAATPGIKINLIPPRRRRPQDGRQIRPPLLCSAHSEGNLFGDGERRTRRRGDQPPRGPREDGR